MTVHIMLDLETMGVGRKPAITEIAAVVFDPMGEGAKELSFYTGVNLVDSILSGLDVSQSTVEFWRNQSDDAKCSTVASQEKAKTLHASLCDFFDFIDAMKSLFNDDDIRLWGNGILSDNLWIMSACEAVGIDFHDKIRHWQHSNFITIMDACEMLTDYNPKKTIEMDGVLHDPIDDCHYQIACVQAAFAEMNK